MLKNGKHYHLKQLIKLCVHLIEVCLIKNMNNAMFLIISGLCLPHKKSLPNRFNLMSVLVYKILKKIGILHNTVFNAMKVWVVVFLICLIFFLKWEHTLLCGIIQIKREESIFNGILLWSWMRTKNVFLTFTNTVKVIYRSLSGSLCRRYDLTGQGKIPILHEINWEIARQ